VVLLVIFELVSVFVDDMLCMVVYVMVDLVYIWFVVVWCDDLVEFVVVVCFFWWVSVVGCLFICVRRILIVIVC